MQKHLVVVEKSGQLPHYRVLDCNDTTLQSQLRQYAGAFPQQKGYQIKVLMPGSYLQPLGEELKN
tara:strand:- start:4506 stop:4700 length:195 start_codon:yes stop_codon:yes gene_type:complete